MVEKYCKLCGSNDRVENHHIIGGNGKRKSCETIESVIPLCWEHHYGTKGWHGRDGRPLQLRVRRELQELYFSQGRTEESVRRLMGGKLYLEVAG